MLFYCLTMVTVTPHYILNNHQLTISYYKQLARSNASVTVFNFPSSDVQYVNNHMNFCEFSYSMLFLRQRTPTGIGHFQLVPNDDADRITSKILTSATAFYLAHGCICCKKPIDSYLKKKVNLNWIVYEFFQRQNYNAKKQHKKNWKNVMTELVCLPGVGIEYMNAKSNFELIAK